MEAKKHIRKQIFAQRKMYTDEEISSMSKEIAKKIVGLPEFQNAEKIMAYADYNHEVMTGYIIEEAWKAGKKVAVPKVRGKEMDFYLLHDFSQLEPGYFGIPEPKEGTIIDWKNALMIMPGVAFDDKLHRVGYGGGFYDRFLEKNPDIYRLAVAFSFQMMPDVPTEPTDIFPNMIVTEKEIYR